MRWARRCCAATMRSCSSDSSGRWSRRPSEVLAAFTMPTSTPPAVSGAIGLAGGSGSRIRRCTAKRRADCGRFRPLRPCGCLVRSTRCAETMTASLSMQPLTITAPKPGRCSRRASRRRTPPTKKRPGRSWPASWRLRERMKSLVSRGARKRLSGLCGTALRCCLAGASPSDKVFSHALRALRPSGASQPSGNVASHATATSSAARPHSSRSLTWRTCAKCLAQLKSACKAAPRCTTTGA